VTLYGRPAADVLGRTLDEVFPELVLEGLGAAWDAALAGTTHMVTNRHVRNTQSGAIVLVDATYGPRRSRDGALAVGGIGVLRDVTAARRQAAELERLSTVVQQTDDGVMVTDAAGCLTWVNAAWERMTGWTLAEVAGRRSGSFLQGVDTDPAAAAALRDAIRAGVGHATELVNYRRDGRPFWSAVTVTPIRDDAGTLSGWVGIKRDVTARKQQEELLRTWSLRDALTGLHNRRGFGAAAEEALRAAGIDPLTRAERLDVTDFARLAAGSAATRVPPGT
jgi:PAS domain S-box-containing protein